MNPPSQLLAIDAGNSRVKIGVFERIAAPGELPKPLKTLAFPVGDPIPWDRLPASVERAVIAGSNPREIARILAAWRASTIPIPQFVESFERLPLNINVPAPERVGMDRLLNAVAANVLRPEEQPAIIVSCGTATTVDYVSETGVFEGGAILPGFDLGGRSLHDYTALLPFVSSNELENTPPGSIGKETRAAIASGLLWGQVGAVKEIVGRQTQVGRPPVIFLTGGAATLLAPHLGIAVRREPDLALRGLALTGVNIHD